MTDKPSSKDLYLVLLGVALVVVVGTFIVAIDQPANYSAAANSSPHTEPESFGFRFIHDPIAILTLVLAIIAVIQTLVFGRQAKRLRETVEAMERIDARQGERIEESIAETRRIGEAQVRAYVNVKKAKVQFMEKMGVPAVGFIVSNSGQSPARNFLWNVTVQYSAPPNSSELSFNKANWLNETGIDVPAGVDVPFDGAWVPLSAKEYIEKPNPRANKAVIRVRIDFRFTDVFDKHWLGEAYFSGLMGRTLGGVANIDGAQIRVDPSAWSAIISPMPKPRDWDELGKKT
jgi:hypothetical protein